MRNTLLTVAAFALCATGVGYATADLMPDPTARPAAVSTGDRPSEPVARGSEYAPQPATAAPLTSAAPATRTALSNAPAAVAGGDTAVEAPAPAAVTPQPVPVAAPAETPAPAPVVEAPEVAEQLPEEVIGRQLDGPDGSLCTVVDADLTTVCEPTP